MRVYCAALKKEQQLLQQDITDTKMKIEDAKEPRVR